MTLPARAAMLVAALALVVLALGDARPGEAHHLCGATGSPRGPFDIRTYEAEDYRTVYARTLELAGFNQLFPDLSAFAVPELDTGPRNNTKQADPYIPPVLLKAIASIESSWAQADYSVPYGAVGGVLASHDCGYGIMQITSGMQNITGAPNLEQAMIGGHFAFNIAKGAHILAGKWNMAPELRPIVGDADTKIIENWYFALWGYNGFAFQNHPLNPAYSLQRADFSCGPADDGFGHDRTRYPYQELVYGCVKHPPVRGGQTLWQPQDVHMPDLRDPKFAGPLDTSNWSACSFSAQCASMDIPTPNTNHRDATELAVQRDDVIGSPSISVTPAAIELTSIPSVAGDRKTVTVSNPGTGVLSYRISTTKPWIKVSRSQSVSLGQDLGGVKSSFTVRADTSGLPPGTYEGSVVIESLHASNAPRKIPVRVTNYPSGTLIAGSGPEVYVVSRGLKRWIPNRETFEANGFNWGSIVKVPDTALGSIPTGNPLMDVLSDGYLIAGSGPEVYAMENGFKRHITSRAAMSACGYSFADITKLPQTLVARQPEGAPIEGRPCPRLSPPDGTLLGWSGPEVFVVRGGLKRHIPDPHTLEGLGYKWGNIDRVGDSILARMPTGLPLVSVLSDGMPLKDSVDGSVYVMRKGAKRIVNDADVMAACGYSEAAAYKLSPSRLHSIPNALPLLTAPCPQPQPRDGSLIAGSDGRIYLMHRGLARHVPDRETFEARGFSAGNVDKLHQSLVDLMEKGDPLLSVLTTGSVIKGNGDEVYVMDGGLRRPTSLMVLVKCGYGVEVVNVISDARLQKIGVGQPVTEPPCPALALPDGTLINGGGPEVYVMLNGRRQHVTSRDVFVGCGYEWGNINVLPGSLVGQLAEGPALTGPPCP